MILKWTAETHAPIGHCIYCGSDCGPITDEHIIPHSLLPKGGDWFLPRASCSACSDITGAFEGRCVDSMFGKLRVHLSLKQRKRIFVKAAINDDGSRFETVTVRISEFPMLGMGIRWPLPGILLGEAPSEALIGEPVVREREGDVLKFARPGRGMHIGKIVPVDLALMLAKIAHSYAVARKGEAAFRPLLRDLIRGKYNKYAFLIGGGETPSSPSPPQPNVLHHVSMADAIIQDVTYLIVYIRLFAFMGLPRYSVVVGEMAA